MIEGASSLMRSFVDAYIFVIFIVSKLGEKRDKIKKYSKNFHLLKMLVSKRLLYY